ncbi:CLUMA_CG007425, isoform A [Clunio marinus]|uniref:CLUMA_CG007425, isoform A n=1 Tax=Clunio marinus TaxID=568069 RepID=A0A1J1I2A6_9DIPT|nr:CLUMA_CG007425, isoform A [Clunio marinus]
MEFKERMQFHLCMRELKGKERKNKQMHQCRWLSWKKLFSLCRKLYGKNIFPQHIRGPGLDTESKMQHNCNEDV